MNNEFYYSLKDITNLLENFSFDYMVTGGLAQNVYIKPRKVKDIDIVIDLTIDRIDELLDLLKTNFEFRRVHKKIHYGGMFNIIHSVSQNKIDIILCKSTEYNQLEFRNKLKKNILGLYLNCVSIEDLIISKLIWIQDLRIEKHLIDLSQLIYYQDLKTEYISYWCNRLNLETYGIIL